VTTQLRLVETPEPRSRPVRAKAAPARRTSARAIRRTTRTGRRAASWGDWHLDARTRRVGRAGVARAREALEAVMEDELSRAS
jgi:hypothetical protein